MKSERLKKINQCIAETSFKRVNRNNISNCIKENLIVGTDLLKFFFQLDKAAKRNGLDIIFDFSATNHTDFAGQTIKMNKAINIELRRNMSDDEYALSILAHEMGETDYLLRGLPTVTGVNGRCSISSRLTELFSHSHIHRLLEEYGLEKYNIFLENRNSEIWRLKDYESEYNHEGVRVLMLTWALITYPSLRDSKNDLQGYTKYSNSVSEILDIVLTTSTFGSVNTVVTSMKTIINILSDYKLEGMQIERNF
ncbi:hypothetical protein NST54_16355 [Caldifermentibacillus hisashii]|uniref:hypothetical protein n=1 Tax=Caldifermentibacillus hisashii TaxID=996558 RepID=UPI0034D59EFC